jgi:hypothetical protein
MGKNNLNMGNARINTRKIHMIRFVRHEIIYRRYAQVQLKNGVTEANHAEYLQAKKRAQTGETILDGISLLDDNDDAEGDEDDESVLSIIEA